MLLPSSVVSREYAAEKGYKALSRPFFLPKERAMLDNMQRDLNGIDFCLVGDCTAPEVWRRNWISLTESSAIKIQFEKR